MLRACRELIGCRVAGKESDFGKVSDIYFNDQTWKIEFFVLTLGRGRSARSVLLPIQAVASLDLQRRILVTSWTEDQLENAPSANSVLPVSRQCELLTPGALSRGSAGSVHTSPFLRSYLSLKGYIAISEKQPRGEISDLILDDVDWSVRYIQLQFSLQKKVVHFNLHSLSIDRFSCASRKIFLKHFEPVQVDDQILVQFPAAISSEASFA